MKANETHCVQRYEPESRCKTHWTWELEAIVALLVLVWLAGIDQFLRHVI